MGNANIDIGVNVNVVQRKPDEEFEWNGLMEGIVDNPKLFLNNESELLIVNGSVLIWNKDIFKTPQFKQCLTSAVLVRSDGIRRNLDIKTEEVSNVDEHDCIRVEYKYKDKIFLLKNITSSSNYCVHHEDSHVNSNMKMPPIKEENTTVDAVNEEKDNELVENEKTLNEASLSPVVVSAIVIIILLILLVIGLVLYRKRKNSIQRKYHLDDADVINEESVEEVVPNENTGVLNTNFDMDNVNHFTFETATNQN